MSLVRKIDNMLTADEKLRDEFAMAALTRILMTTTTTTTTTIVSNAKLAYMYADAMMEARDKKDLE